MGNFDWLGFCQVSSRLRDAFVNASEDVGYGLAAGVVEVEGETLMEPISQITQLRIAEVDPRTVRSCLSAPVVTAGQVAGWRPVSELELLVP